MTLITSVVQSHATPALPPANESSRRIPPLGRWLWLAIGLALGGVLLASTQSVYLLQNEMASLAAVLPVGYAFSAGMVATVNPCGVLMLPSIVALYLGGGEGMRSPAQRAGHAVVLGSTATLGFLAIFTLVGLIVGAGGWAIAAAFPIAGFIVGSALTTLGVWLALTGRAFGLSAATRAMAAVPRQRNARAFFLFGIAYAVSSLACTLPVFLVVAGSALARGGVAGAAGQFVSYALGMGSVLTVLLVSAALFEGVTRHWLQMIVPWVHRVSASFLIGAGIFVAGYWLRAGLLR